MEIRKLRSFSEIDREKFIKLVESGFKRRLIPDYFESTYPKYIYLAIENGDYVGAIVVEEIPELENVSYLDKIVVAPEYQGNGIGKILWEHLKRASKKTIWRAKKQNPIIPFYEQKSDGKLSSPNITDFMFFYYGLNSSELEKAVGFAIKKKSSLEDNRI